MPKARSVLWACQAVALLLLAWSLASTPVDAKPAPRSQPTLAMYGLAIPATACGPIKKLSPDEKLCGRRDEAACERLALAALQQPDRALDCAVWRALGRGFVSSEAVQSERLLRAVLGLVDRQVGGAADQGKVHAAQLQVRRELLQRFAPAEGSELARGLRRDMAVLGLLGPVVDLAGCSAAAAYLKGQPRDGKAQVVEGFVPTALGALGPLVQPPWARLALAVKASGDTELRGECGLVLRETVVELLVQPDWDQLGGVGQWQALVAAWIDGRSWQVELAEAAIPRLCQEKAEDAQRCERAALLGTGLVALAPLAAEAERRQMGVIRGWDAVARDPSSGALARADEPKVRLASERALRGVQRRVAEREKYLTVFGEGGAWFAKWKGLPAVGGAQVARLRQVRVELAPLMHAEAQWLKSEGKFEEAFAQYGRAAVAYEALLAEDPSGPDAYKLAWTLGECWYWAGVQCTAPLDKSGNLIEFEGDVAPTPVERVPALHKSCESMRKAIDWYRRVRDWRGQRGKRADGRGLDFTEEAAWSALEGNERVMAARASLPKGDPEYLAALALPQIRPLDAVDDADLKAVAGMKEVTRVKPRPLPPEAVEWLLEADAYMELAATHTSVVEQGRHRTAALKAAELLYKYRHFDPWPAGASKRTPAEFWSARLRFRRIFERFPGVGVATEAVKRMISSFGLEQDINGLEKFLNEIETRQLVPDEPSTQEPREIHPPWVPIDQQARELAMRAQELERAALALPNRAERAAVLANARELYHSAGDAYLRIRDASPRVWTKADAIEAAFSLHYRAVAWDRCVADLNLADEILREALRRPDFATPPGRAPRRATKLQRKEADESKAEFDDNRRHLLDRLDHFLTVRADVHLRLADVEGAAKDYMALYHLDPRGPRAVRNLRSASRFTAGLGHPSRAATLLERLVIDFAKNSAETETVQTTAWTIPFLHRQANNPTAEVAALTAFVTRYKADKSASGRVFRSLARTAELQTDLGQAAAATATRKRIVATFAARALPRETAPEARVAAQAALDLLKPQVQAFLTTKPNPAQLPNLQADLSRLVTATQAVDSYDAPLVHASAAALRSRLRRHYAQQARATAPELAAQLQAAAVADLTNLLKAQPASTELRQELHYYQPDLTPPAGFGLVADFDPPGTLPLAIELPAPASDSAVAAPFNQALTHYRTGQTDRAIAAALRAVQLDPAHSRSKILLSTLQLRSGDPTGALATVDAGLSARPTDVMLLAQKVLALAALGKTPEALQIAQAALRLDHSNPELQRVVGDAYRLAGRDGLAELPYDIARSGYLDDLATTDESAPPIKQYEDRKLRSYGTLQGVDAEALPRDAGLAHLTAAMARLILWKPWHPDLQATRDDLESALKLRQDAAELHADLGAVLLALGDRAALPTLHKALELRQGDARLLNNLALALRISGQPQQARATLDQAHLADPQLAAPLYNLALLRCDSLRDAGDLAEIRKLLAQFKQLRGPMPAGQADPADTLLAEAEALLSWRAGVTP